MALSDPQIGRFTRRAALTAGGAAALAGGLARHDARAADPAWSPAAAPRGIIDIHHHPIPASFREALRLTPGQSGVLGDWSVQKSLAEMDEGGVATSLLSIPAPYDIWTNDPPNAGRRAREWNEYVAGLARDHPGRFGLLATVPTPLPDVALREIAYAYDTLGAVGVGITTNIGDRWLGDPAYAPILEDLDRRNALVFVHPGVARCCENLMPEISDATVELTTDTTRAITRLLFSGSAARYRGIRFVFSHGGGTMPFMVGRLLRLPKMNPKLVSAVPDGVIAALQRFHYDVALAANPYAMASLRRLVPTSQIVFGTDYPFATARDTLSGLLDCGFTDGELQAVGSGNLRRLLKGA